MSGQADIERIARERWVRDILKSGRALEICRAAGVTVADVADACGVCRPQAWQWLHGRIQRPHPKNIRALAHLLAQLEMMMRDE